MSRKFIFPTLVLVLAVLACNLQTAAPTALPLTPTSTVGILPLATNTSAIPVATIPSVITPTDTSTALPSDTPIPPTAVPPTAVQPTAVPPTAVPPTAAPAGLTLDLLRNGTYHAPYFDRTVTLVNGSYSEGSGTTAYSVQMSTVYALGDINGDGKADAAVILSENAGGGTGSFESLIAVTDQGGAPHQSSQVELGDRVLVNSADISSGVVHLDMVVHAPADPLCCPSQPQKQNFWLIGNKLWLMRVTSNIAGVDHSINISSPANWATAANPFTVTGSVTVLPFENTLAYHIYRIDGTKVNESSFTVTPGSGTSGTFSQVYNLSSAGITDWFILQLVDVSAADGGTISMASVIMKNH